MRECGWIRTNPSPQLKTNSSGPSELRLGEEWVAVSRHRKAGTQHKQLNVPPPASGAFRLHTRKTIQLSEHHVKRMEPSTEISRDMIIYPSSYNYIINSGFYHSKTWYSFILPISVNATSLHPVAQAKKQKLSFIPYLFLWTLPLCRTRVWTLWVFTFL